jgi:hypothetical protein
MWYSAALGAAALVVGVGCATKDWVNETVGVQVLAESYGWFTEGFETHDLHEAKALWQALH